MGLIYTNAPVRSCGQGAQFETFTRHPDSLPRRSVSSLAWWPNSVDSHVTAWSVVCGFETAGLRSTVRELSLMGLAQVGTGRV